MLRGLLFAAACLLGFARAASGVDASALFADGERAFWSVLHGDDHSIAKQEAAIAGLTKAVKRDPKDGWPPFLLGMLHLYRFAQATVRFDQVSDAARADLVAANAAFARALPLLWDGRTGDSRVPGFVAAATSTSAVVVGVVGLAVLSLIATVLAGFGSWFDFLELVRRVSDPITTEHNFTPGAVAYQLGVSAGAAAILQVLVTIGVLGVTGVAALRARAEASYLATIVASQLVSPILWDHYALLLLLPVAWLLERGHRWAIVVPLAATPGVRRWGPSR